MTDIVERAQVEPVTADDAKEKAKEKGQELREQVSTRVREQVQTQASSAGQQAQSFSQTMRRTASELRTQGQQGQGAVLVQVAIRAEQLAGYLSEADPDQLVTDARDYAQRGLEFAKKQPWLIAPIGLGVGIVAARVLAQRSGSQQS